MTDPQNHLDEDLLNPPPKRYRVSTRTKVVFLVSFLGAVLLYFGMVVDRRIKQSQYLLENEMAAVKLRATPLPDIPVLDIKTQTISPLKKSINGWTLLNIWATWCPPCQAEMPSLEHLQQTLNNKLTVVALSVDESSEAVVDFVKTHNPSFTVVWDREKMAPLRFSASKYPETFLISPEGMLVAQFSGPRDWASSAALRYFARFF